MTRGECVSATPTLNCLHCSYNDLFDFQCKLLDTFPRAAGANGVARIIPQLPGKSSIKTSFFSITSNKRAATQQLEESRMGACVRVPHRPRLMLPQARLPST